MDLSGYFSQPGTSQLLINVLIVVISIWTIFWKSLALWSCATHGQKNWFIALMILNTVGILEIIYLFRFSKKRYTIKAVLELIRHPKI